MPTPEEILANDPCPFGRKPPSTRFWDLMMIAGVILFIGAVMITWLFSHCVQQMISQSGIGFYRTLPPLHRAIWEKDVPRVKELLESGAVLDEADGHGCRPLYYLFTSHDLRDRRSQELLKALFDRRVDMNAKVNEHADTPLLQALERKEDRFAEYLLTHGVDPQRASSSGFTPLHKAAIEGIESITSLLLEKKVGVDPRTRKGCSPLHLAKTPGIVRLLIKARADVRLVDDAKDTALHHAAEDRDPAVVQALLASGAEVNSRNKKGETAVHRAVDRVFHDIASDRPGLEVLRLLARAGADLQARSAEGLTPLEFGRPGRRLSQEDYAHPEKNRPWIEDEKKCSALITATLKELGARE